MNKIIAIETKFDGYRFRSRTEARWAVFFKTAGIKYEYEKEGFVLDGTPYLPDFWLSDFNFWLEVKGVEPSVEECRLCEMLSQQCNCKVLLAVGAPEPHNQIIVYSSDDELLSESRYYFCDDRRNEGEFWLMSDDAHCFSIGPVRGPDHDRYPLVFTYSANGYAASRSARFESAIS